MLNSYGWSAKDIKDRIMKLFLIGILVLSSNLTLQEKAFSQPANIEDAIEHCRVNGHRDNSCESLCEQGIDAGCLIIAERERNNGRNNNSNKNLRDQIIGGIVGGVLSGIISNSRNRNKRPETRSPTQSTQSTGGLSNAHYAYCQNKYKSYQIATNSYTSFSGKTKYCNSPHN